MVQTELQAKEKKQKRGADIDQILCISTTFAGGERVVQTGMASRGGSRPVPFPDALGPLRASDRDSGREGRGFSSDLCRGPVTTVFVETLRLPSCCARAERAERPAQARREGRSLGLTGQGSQARTPARPTVRSCEPQNEGGVGKP